MKNKPNSGRRQFITNSIPALIFSSTLGIVTVSSLIQSCTPVASPYQNLPPSPEDVDINNYPTLENINGFAKVKIPHKNYGKPVIIIRDSETQFTILSSICTHQGCEVSNPDLKTKVIFCPCHGSKFNLNGKVIKGPASRALTSYDYTFDKSTNVLTFTI